MTYSMKRTWVEVNLDRIIHNYNLAKTISGNKNVIPVIKANAYGHGAVAVAKTLEKQGVDTFAVSALSEAVELRDGGIKADILILGVTMPEDFPLITELDIIQQVSDVDYAKKLNDVACAQNKKARVHIKVDTGMARIGFAVRNEENINSALSEITKVCNMDNISVEGIFSHFATADVPDSDFAKKQYQLFCKLIDVLEQNNIKIPHKHTANSGAIINYDNDKFDMVRQGIILYGYLPDSKANKNNFLPALSMKSVVSHIARIKKGESIGYGRSYVAQKDMTVGVIPIGYADGYSRALSNKGEMLISGKLCSVCGRVCMDQLMVDITGLDVKIGDEVTVMGEGAWTADDIASAIGTICYEVLCDISPRPPRIYIKNNKML